MTDDNDAGPAETPIQRALRLKKAAQGAKPARPGDGLLPRKGAGGEAAGKSKPWMKR